jgi:hypothetical protein
MVKVSYEDASFALTSRSEAGKPYVDLMTGDVVFINRSAMVHDEDFEEDYDSLPQWLKDDICEYREIQRSKDHYVIVPFYNTADAYAAMVGFAKQQNEPVRGRLLKALDGRGAFARFKDIVWDDKDLYRSWGQYSAEDIKQNMCMWAQLHGFEFEYPDAAGLL